MNRKAIITAAAAAALLALTGAQGGCGSSGSTGTTTVQGNPASAKKCKSSLIMQAPVGKLLTATYTVSCNFPVASADTSLVIQGRPIGGSNADWDNLSDPKRSSATTDISLTYTVPCITSLQYQASASIDALADDGTPFNSSDTTTPKSYGASECTQGKN